MAINVIKNQPVQVSFAKVYGGGHEYELLQRVQLSDKQKVQIKCSPNTTPTDYSDTGWTVAGSITHAGTTLTAAGAGTASKTVAVTAGKRYAISFTVNFTGIDSAGGGYRVKINSQYLKLPDALGGGYSILSGAVTTYLTVDSFIGSAAIEFETSGADTALSITKISIGQLSEVGVLLLDEVKASVSIPVGGITVTDVADSPITNVLVNWTAIDLKGLYYLRFYDALNYDTQLLLNGDFTGSLSNWEAEDGGALEWTVVSNKADYDGSGTSHGNTLSQLVNVPGGSIYTLTFTTSGMSLSETVQVYYYANGVIGGLTNFGAAGPYNYTIDLSDVEGLVDLRVVFKPLAPAQTFAIDNVVLKRAADIANTTHIFDVQEKHPFTLSFYATNNKSAYDFNYTAFYAQLRVKAEILFKDFPDKTTQVTFSDQVTEIIQGTAQKQYEVFVHGAPEYIHDALRLMRLSDVFTIDGKPYVAEGDYKLEFTDGVYCPAARFLVRPKQGIALNNFEEGSTVTSIEVL